MRSSRVNQGRTLPAGYTRNFEKACRFFGSKPKQERIAKGTPFEEAPCDNMHVAAPKGMQRYPYIAVPTMQRIDSRDISSPVRFAIRFVPAASVNRTRDDADIRRTQRFWHCHGGPTSNHRFQVFRPAKEAHDPGEFTTQRLAAFGADATRRRTMLCTISHIAVSRVSKPPRHVAYAMHSAIHGARELMCRSQLKVVSVARCFICV